MAQFFITSEIITIRELSEKLGICRDVIEKRVNEMYPGLMKKGVKTKLTQRQATDIKKRIIENSYLAITADSIRLKEMPKTKLEVIENYEKAKDDYERLMAREEMMKGMQK